MEIIINLPNSDHDERVLELVVFGLELLLLLLDPDVVQALPCDTPRQMGMEFLCAKQSFMLIIYW